MKTLLKRTMPPSLWQLLRNANHAAARGMRRGVEALGFIIQERNAHYGSTPSEFVLRKTQKRWNKPSSLHGVAYDLDAMEALLDRHCRDYLSPFQALPAYADMAAKGLGFGFPHVDAFTLHAMLRDLRPKRYLEVGSGLSSAYAHQALTQPGDGPVEITCVEPYPHPPLRALQGIKLIVSEGQDVPMEEFLKLKANDVLFIDTSHVVKIDGEVPYFFLEVLPRLAPGVVIHIHDIPFPYNIPYPAEYWTLLDHPGSFHWPMYWNEAMLLQALLSGSDRFEIIQSLPMLRHFREESLRSRLPFYQPVSEEPNTFSSIWLRKRA